MSGAADQAIGVFDSGVGGLTVMQKLIAELPSESLLYLGDTGRYPYGNKSPEIVTRYSCENAEFLLEKGIKLLVVACNSASSVAVETLKERYRIPVIDVVEPGARAAAAATRNMRVGVVGTEVTIASGSYTRALKRLRPGLEIYTRACPLFVPLVEEGWTDNEVARTTIALYLASLQRSGIDTLILGCTHYPLLKPAISEFLGSSVRLVDSAEETARAVRETLEREGMASARGEGAVGFFVTDVPERFVRIGRRFLDERVESTVRIER